MTKKDVTVAILDNSLSGALHYFDDEFHRYLDYGGSIFNLSITKKHTIYSNASTGTEDDFQYLKENHFLVFRYKNKDYKFTIRRVEETETSLRLFCEDLSFDLLNEYRGPYKADKAYSISKYVNDCLVDSGYEIGINEFAKNERTLEWEGEQTVLKRLLSICNSFGAEIEFETVLNNDRTVKQQLVHLKKRVGVNRPDVELKYGRDVSSIRRSVDNTGLFTAIKPRGHEEDGKVTTITNVEKEIKDENGNVVFYTKKGSEYIYAPMANQEYGNPKRKGGGYVGGQFSYDTKSDTELFNRALTELEKKSVPAYEFEIEGFYDIDIGDTIRAIDEGYNPILLLEARISEQTISFSDPTKNKTVYSNYRILENKVSQSLLDRIDEVKKYAEQVAKTYIFSINNMGSPMFKNGEGKVTFTAKIERNNQDFTGEFTEFNWIKQNKDGSLDTGWNAEHTGMGKDLTVVPSDFVDTATFTYQALQDGISIGGASGIVTNVNDGEDGKTPVKGVDYFDGVDGSDGKDGEDGSNGISVSSVVEEYYVSTSPTSQAGGAWSTTVPNNADPNKYIWRRLKTTMSDSTVTYTNPALIQGMTGIYPYIGPTQPANPKEGQQWWKSDASGNVTNFYVYKSGSWQGQTIQQSVLNIIELNAVRILGSTITGTTINTSTLNNSGTYQDSGATIIYNSTYNGNITADWAVENSTQNGTFILSPRNLAAISYTDAARKNPGWHWVIDNNGIDVGNPSYSAIYGGEGITIYNAQLSPTYGRVKLEFQDLMTLPEIQLTPKTGFAIYGTDDLNRPTAKRQGRVVQLKGAFKNTAQLDRLASATMGTLPVGYRPASPVNTVAQGSGDSIYLVTVQPNGNIDFGRYRSMTAGFIACGANSWLNVACVYSAADI